MDSNGKVIDQIQTKFVGKNGTECCKLLLAGRYDKYVESPEVTKIEVPKDFYADVLKGVQEKIKKDNTAKQNYLLQGQKESAAQIEKRILRNKTLLSKLEKSNTTTSEAMFAAKYPKTYTASIFSSSTLENSVTKAFKAVATETIKGAGVTAAITGISSLTMNLKDVHDGKMDITDAMHDTLKDTAMSGAINGGIKFITSTSREIFSNSKSALLKKLGSAGIPAIAISYAVESYDTVSGLFLGEISISEATEEMGRNAAILGGDFVGASAGAMLGGAIIGLADVSATSLVGIATPAVLGIAGGIAGTLIASELYSAACEFVPDALQSLGDSVQKLASDTISYTQEAVPKAISQVQNAFNEFFQTNKLPFSV